MDEIEPQLGEGGEMDTLADWGSKLTGLAVRLCGIIHMLGISARPKVGGYCVCPDYSKGCYSNCSLWYSNAPLYLMPWERAKFWMGLNMYSAGFDATRTYRSINVNSIKPRRTVFDELRIRWSPALLMEHHYIRQHHVPKCGPGRPPSAKYRSQS